MRVTIVLSGSVVVFSLLAACGRGSVPAPDTAAGPATDSAAVPAPPEHEAGGLLFATKCAECHGPAGEGTETGPPFMHPFYVPGHHGDDAFVSAAINGVTAHHWTFGDMPPVEGITEPEVRQVVAYVRWLQVQRGIE